MDAYQPSKYARKDWQLAQERNLQYVAATRAMSELVHVIVTSNAQPREAA